MLGDEVAEAADPEGLGRPVTGREEVDPELARVGQRGFGRLAGEEGVEAERGGLVQGLCPAAGNDADRLDRARPAREVDDVVALEDLRAARDQLVGAERLVRAPGPAERAAAAA